MSGFHRPTAIDLFCGAGGMSLGFEQAGFDVLAAVDLEKRNVETYRLNAPHTNAVAADLSATTGDTIRKHAKLGDRELDVLFGGPPCQGFSVGGVQDVDDPRNTLVYDFARLVRELNPKYFVMENVNGLMHKHAEPVLKSFLRRVRRAGYCVVDPIQILNAADYGVPQRRRRTFVLGYRKDLPAPSYPSPRGIVDESGREYAPVVAQAIGDLPNVDKYKHLLTKETYRGRLGKPSHYAAILRGDILDTEDRSPMRTGKHDGITGCFRTVHSKTTERRFARTEQGRAEPISRYHRLHLEGIANTLRAGTGSDRGSHTAPRPIHPTAPRCITVREAARLHSYPDWFRFHATRWHAFRQIGNSVPPRLARAVASALHEIATRMQ